MTLQRLPIRDLLECVSQTFGVARNTLIGRSRQRHIVVARQAAAWLIKRRLLSYWCGTATVRRLSGTQSVPG
jgi:chromosomal replication initiation ATPase DnaA